MKINKRQVEDTQITDDVKTELFKTTSDITDSSKTSDNFNIVDEVNHLDELDELDNNEENIADKPKLRVTTLDDIDDKDEGDKLTQAERIKEIMSKTSNLPPCHLDKKLDEKLKNIMTYSTIPFVLVSIGLSLFNIGRIRYAFSFLFLSLGLAIMAVFYFIRNKNLKKCNCPVCETQAKNTFQFSILWGLMAVALMSAFIYFAATQ